MATTVNFRGSLWDVRARMLWQALFNFYREQGCPLERMDNMLIDYGLCKEAMDLLQGGSAQFIWGCEPGAYMTSWIWSESWQGHDVVDFASWQPWEFYVLCDLSVDEATFTVVKEPEGIESQPVASGIRQRVAEILKRRGFSGY